MEIGFQMIWLMGVVLRNVRVQMAQKLRVVSPTVTYEEFLILRIVWSYPAITQKGIVQLLVKDKSIVFRQVNRMLSNGWLLQSDDPLDRRQKLLLLTKQGEDLLTVMEQYLSNVQVGLFEGLTEIERQQMQNIFGRILLNSRKLEVEEGNYQ